MRRAIAVLGARGDVASLAVASVTSAGYEPLLVDAADADVPTEHPPIQGAIVCPDFGLSAPELADQRFETVLGAVAPTGPVIGIAAEEAARGGTRADQPAVLRGDAEVLRRLRSLQDSAAATVRACLILHGKLVPAFADCRGETQEMAARPGELERAHVVEAVRFALSLPQDVVVRELVIEAPGTTVDADGPRTDPDQPIAARTGPDHRGA